MPVAAAYIDNVSWTGPRRSSGRLHRHSSPKGCGWRRSSSTATRTPSSTRCRTLSPRCECWSARTSNAQVSHEQPDHRRPCRTVRGDRPGPARSGRRHTAGRQTVRRPVRVDRPARRCRSNSAGIDDPVVGVDVPCVGRPTTAPSKPKSSGWTIWSPRCGTPACTVPAARPVGWTPSVVDVGGAAVRGVVVAVDVTFGAMTLCLPTVEESLVPPEPEPVLEEV